MNRREAFEELGLPTDASDEDVKKRTRELMKQYHPDVNKDPTAEAKFKHVNEAAETIKSGVENAATSFSSPFNDIGFGSMFESIFGGDFFNAQHSSRSSRSRSVGSAEDINIDVTLSFKESMLGAHRDVEFDVIDDCDACLGHGAIPDNASSGAPQRCSTCKGSKRVSKSQNVHGMGYVITTTCDACLGTGVAMKQCITCGGKGLRTYHRSRTIDVPTGVVDGSVMNVREAGHRSTVFGRRSNVKINVHVTKDDRGLSYDGNANVVCTVKLLLVDAIRGTSVTVPTLYGECAIEVPPRRRHGDIFVISGLGRKLSAETSGDQIVHFDVAYPDDVEKLIAALTSHS